MPCECSIGRGQKKPLDFLELEYRWLWPTWCCWEPRPGPLQEQLMLLTVKSIPGPPKHPFIPLNWTLLGTGSKTVAHVTWVTQHSLCSSFTNGHAVSPNHLSPIASFYSGWNLVACEDTQVITEITRRKACWQTHNSHRFQHLESKPMFYFKNSIEKRGATCFSFISPVISQIFLKKKWK